MTWPATTLATSDVSMLGPKRSLFVEKVKVIKSERDLDRLTHSTSVEASVEQFVAWAKGILRAARLPTDLRVKTEPGRSFIVLFDKVRPGSVEEHAANVLKMPKRCETISKTGTPIALCRPHY
jgi:hypothetical protein